MLPPLRELEGFSLEARRMWRMYREIVLSRTTARVLLGSLTCVGLLSCSSPDKAKYETASGAAASPSSVATSPPSSVPSTAASPNSLGTADTAMARAADTATGSGTAASTADTAVAPSQASLPVAPPKHANRADRRHGNGTTRLGARPLKRQGLPCVPLASNGPARADFSSSPSTVNPCGVGSMNLPTMAPPSLANPR